MDHLTVESTTASPASLADALGLAWAAFTLYEDPSGADAYLRAVDTLTRCPSYPWTIDVGADGFLAEGEVLPERRDATRRVARRLFSLGAASLELTAPPSARDVLLLFRTIATDDDALDHNAVLRRDDVTTIAISMRTLELPGDESAAWYLAADADPTPFIERILRGDSSPELVASRFMDEYQHVIGLVDPSDRWGTEEVVHAFIDAFWYLPADHRGEVFSQMLERQDRQEAKSFLDQFGTFEIAEVQALLEAPGHALLSEYMRVAGEEGGRRPADLSDLLGGSADAGHAKDVVQQSVAHDVADVLRATAPSGTPASEAALERLRAATPGRRDHGRSALNVVRGLLGLGEHAEAIGRAAVPWADRVATALSAGNVAAADAWMSALAGIRLGRSGQAAVFQALERRLDSDAVDTVASLLGDAPTGRTARLAPFFAGARLAEELGTEQQMRRRRELIAALVPVARANPTVLLSHLKDPRWYVVRNIALVLGRAQAADALDDLLRTAHHADPRVRVEALKSIVRIDPAVATPLLVAALGDADDSVAAEAAALAGRSPDPAVDRTLTTEIEQADRDAVAPLIEALGRRSTPSARAALTSLAGGPPALWGRRRIVRRSARQALEAGS